MIKTGIPLDRATRRTQAGAVTLLDPYSPTNKSRVFEVRNLPIVLQAFDLEIGEEVLVLSVVRVAGQDIEQVFMPDGQPVRLTSIATATVLNISGRYRVEVLNSTGNAKVTYTLQNAHIGGDVGMPSGAQANRPNLFLDNAAPNTISNIIEIQERPWVFNAYGLGPSNTIEVYQVHGYGATYVEELYLPKGQPAVLTEDSNALRLDTSGRYRFKLTGVGSGVTLVGNPTTVQSGAGDGSGTPGPPGPPGPPTPPLILVAAEVIHGRRAVRAISGQAYHPSLAIDDHAEQTVGISLNASNIGGAVEVRTVGTVTDNAWVWAPGYVYVGEGGILTQTPQSTGWLLSIGRAINATTIDVDVDTAFFRG